MWYMPYNTWHQYIFGFRFFISDLTTCRTTIVHLFSNLLLYFMITLVLFILVIIFTITCKWFILFIFIKRFAYILSIIDVVCTASVAAETRYCTVSVSSGPQHLVDFGRTRQQSETLGSRCGDTSRPWTIDALNGQRIVVSLIHFTTNANGGTPLKLQTECKCTFAIML